MRLNWFGQRNTLARMVARATVSSLRRTICYSSISPTNGMSLTPKTHLGSLFHPHPPTSARPRAQIRIIAKPVDRIGRGRWPAANGRHRHVVTLKLSSPAIRTVQLSSGTAALVRCKSSTNWKRPRSLSGHGPGRSIAPMMTHWQYKWFLCVPNQEGKWAIWLSWASWDWGIVRRPTFNCGRPSLNPMHSACESNNSAHGDQPPSPTPAHLRCCSKYKASRMCWCPFLIGIFINRYSCVFCRCRFLLWCRLCVAGASGHVILFKFRKTESVSEYVVSIFGPAR